MSTLEVQVNTETRQTNSIETLNMKQRVSSLDLRFLVSEIEKASLGYRLQNIYNLVSNSRSFLFKFAIPDSKVNLILESGFKLYLTEYQRPTDQQPSNFVSKLRKHLKTKRLTNIKQVGNDRIVVMEFSDGFYYLVLEFFSAGNIVLLDTDMKILSVFRLVEEHDNNDRYAVGQVYSMFDKTLFDKTETESTKHIFTKEEVLNWVKKETEKVSSSDEANKKVLSIHKLAFINASYLSSDLLKIMLDRYNVASSSSSLSLLTDEETLSKVVDAMNETENELTNLLETPSGQLEGYIISKLNPLYKPSDPNVEEEEQDDSSNLQYIFDEFHPYEPVNKKTETNKFEIVKGYNKTLDKFFTTIESSKSTLKRQQQQHNAEKRLQSVKDEQSTKIEKLNNLQSSNEHKAELIMLYNESIEECKTSVRALINQKMDWKNMEKLIKMEQSRGNKIAQMIKLPLNLIKNEITISLPDNIDDEYATSESESDSSSDSESDSEDEGSNTISKKSKAKKSQGDKTVEVVIDLNLSAFANSTRYFDAKKSAQEKQMKTEKSANLAIKNTEYRIAQDMKKLAKESKNSKELKQLRAKYWFEKFWWFISSDGYLCIAGRDANQIDLVYYKHFDNGNDMLVSNDLDGALKVIIKNPYKNKDVPPSTLFQAGMFSLSTTKAWENKMVTSPWFVRGKDVSKKDFDGSILPSGLLNVSREKTYLPPCQLVMGFSLFWIGDENTTEKYKKASIDRDEELGFTLVKGEENTRNKISELKSMLAKLGDVEDIKLEEKPVEKNEVAGADEDDDDEDGNSESSPASTPEPMTDSFTKLTVNPPGPNDQIQTKIRGKKNKLKKIKQKYGDQDEEERRLRMSVLGTLKQVEERESEQDAKTDNNDKSASVNRALRKKQQESHQLKKLISQLESIGENDDDEENDQPSDVSKDVEPWNLSVSTLIHSPNKTDSIIDCIPIFAPYMSLAKNAYKVKIQPGNLKKGKTVADIMEYFKKHTKQLQKDGADWSDSKELVELINQQDALLCLTANKLKVTYPGGDQKPKGNNNGNKSSGKTKSKKK